MCGIAGVFDSAGRLQRPELEAIGRRMQASLAHRGPDEQGLWMDASDNLLLAHRRLSIIDLSGGAQPMRSRCGRFVITYNGELYNYRQLREVLSREGLSFDGDSDTEVLLGALSAWPIKKALSEFVGMYALAIWDTKTRELTLARDRMGEKPLYYGWIGQTFVFASELKAFRSFPGWQKELNPEAVALFFRYNYVPDPYSIFRGLYKLPAATYLIVNQKLAHGAKDDFSPVGASNERPGIYPRKYWQVEMRPNNHLLQKRTAVDYKNDLRQMLQQTVSDKLIADVPLGALLSGGIDSSLVAALSQEASVGSIDTFSIGFDDRSLDEAQFAKSVAQHLGTQHHEMYVTAEDALSTVPQLPLIYDEPFADSSQIPTILVSRLARRSITVALSGDGGDELFAGYNRYSVGQHLLRLRASLPLVFRRALAGLSRTLSPDTWNRVASRMAPLVGGPIANPMFGDKMYKASQLLEAESFQEAYLALVTHWPNVDDLLLATSNINSPAFDEHACSENLGPIERMMLLDISNYLPGDILTKVDRASMSASLEVRAPFLDHRVVEWAAACPLEMKLKEGVGKWILRQVLYEYVPRAMVDRPKMGFSVPLAAWLRGPLKDWACELIAVDSLKRQGWLNPDTVQKKWKEHQATEQNWEHQLWGILMFQSWLQKEGLD